MLGGEDPIYVFRLLWTQFTAAAITIFAVLKPPAHLTSVILHVEECAFMEGSPNANATHVNIWEFKAFRSSALQSVYESITALQKRFDLVAKERVDSIGNRFDTGVY